jgi:hypothetical protein
MKKSNDMKRKYIRPTLQIYNLNNQLPLLTGSGTMLVIYTFDNEDTIENPDEIQ